ncbi:hypothetical protein K488DRAFT_81440 [Vararia minispora EC-137]|uniref:Uncharacterized protein n=1 Tax=Vararia minispora EC-137 TaxID=1314806 RepID=A0ACB8QZZ5_9AGAM|nr:hypothetical protein K488DRAFT_81440 [Vararia minispora EC-137]
MSVKPTQMAESIRSDSPDVILNLTGPTGAVTSPTTSINTSVQELLSASAEPVELVFPPTPTALEPDQPNYMKERIKALRLSRIHRAVDWARHPEDDALPPWASRGVIDSFGSPEQYALGRDEADRYRLSALTPSSSTPSSPFSRTSRPSGMPSPSSWSSYTHLSSTNATTAATSPSSAKSRSHSQNITTPPGSRPVSTGCPPSIASSRSSKSARSAKSVKSTSSTRVPLSGMATLRLRSLSSSSDKQSLRFANNEASKTQSQTETARNIPQSQSYQGQRTMRDVDPAEYPLRARTFSAPMSRDTKGKLTVSPSSSAPASSPYYVATPHVSSRGVRPLPIVPTAPDTAQRAVINDVQPDCAGRPSRSSSASRPPMSRSSTPTSALRHVDKIAAPSYPFPSSAQINLSSMPPIRSAPIKAQTHSPASPLDPRSFAPGRPRSPPSSITLLSPDAVGFSSESLHDLPFESTASPHTDSSVSSDEVEFSMASRALNPSSPSALSPATSSTSLPSASSIRSRESTRSGQSVRPSLASTSTSRRAPSPVSMYSGLNSMLGAPQKPRPLVKLDKTKKEPKAKKTKSQGSLISPSSPSMPSTSSSSGPAPQPSTPQPTRRSLSTRLLSRPSTSKGSRLSVQPTLAGMSRPKTTESRISEESLPDMPSTRLNLSRASVWGRPGPDAPVQHPPLPDDIGIERPMSPSSGVQVLVTSKEKGTWQERDVQDVIWQLRGLKAK